MKSQPAGSPSGSKVRLSKLSSQTLSAMLWMLSGHGFRVALRTGILLVLARLLTPADFGVVAAAFTIISFSEILGMLGIGPALVQRDELEERHIYTGFTFTMLFGAGLTALLWLLSPVIAGFYRDEQVLSVLRVVVLVFPLNSLAVVGESLLQRELRFRRLIGIEIAAVFVGNGLVGIGTALLGWGVWALVAAALTHAFLRTVLILVAHQHSKRLKFDLGAFKELFSFGGGATLIGVLGYLALQGDYLVVGRWLGMDALGLYTRAYHLMGTLSNLIGQALDRVLFSSMAKVQNESTRLATAYKRGIALSGLILLPTSVAAGLLAPEMIHLSLGPGWSEAITPFRILALGIMLRASFKVSLALVRAKGVVYRSAWLQGVYAALVLGGAWVGQHWGLPGVALGVLFALASHYLIMAHFALSLLPLTWKQFWIGYFPAVWMTVVVGLEVWGVTALLRSLGVASILVLIANTLIVPISIFLLIRLAPSYFLGAEGSWLLQALLRKLHRGKIFRIERKQKIAQTPASTDELQAPGD